MLFEDEDLLGTATDTSLVHQPLAERLRPKQLDQFIGQKHLLDADKPLTRAIAAGRLHSMVLWGPPGTGKTTLAKLLTEAAGAHFASLSAVLAGVKDVREAVAQAQAPGANGTPTVLFVDEVHRFNKAQQDAFLPHVEKGTITFIGATTENPSFEVNAALLSRARVYVLRPLDAVSLTILVERAADHLKIQLADDAIEALTVAADGDARRMLNLLDVAQQLSANDRVLLNHVEEAMGERVRRFDKGGDLFYEQISALHKSVRGSAPDAALYWFCRMLDGGADPRYLGRRLLRMASEDVGNADPRALELTQAALAAYERLGSPEGELALAQAVLYLASVPKSDAAYVAFNETMAFVKETGSLDVPMHLRNAPTALMKGLGYGSGYRHAHGEQTEEGGYAAGERYFPEGLDEPQFYRPTTAGLESKISARLARLRELDRANKVDRGES